MIFIQGLISSSEKEVRRRLLTKLEQDQNITLQSLPEDCQRILNLRADTAKIEERDFSNTHTIKNKPQGKKNKRFFKFNPCYGVENCIYLKTVHLNIKNAILAGAKDTNSHTADLRWKLLKEKHVQYTN